MEMHFGILVNPSLEFYNQLKISYRKNSKSRNKIILHVFCCGLKIKKIIDILVEYISGFEISAAW
jgi:hypothetical protein